MPTAANRPAPVSAPASRAVSMVVRDTLIAVVRCWCGMVLATSAPRTPRSDGRMMPSSVARTKTYVGVSRPVSVSVIMVSASAA